MRNRLAHEYDGIDAETVWLTVVRDLPGIPAELEKILDDVQ
ncbi:MAG: HepT-like ribonuclease domain-containing protein [Coriobacteriia bacterium]